MKKAIARLGAWNAVAAVRRTCDVFPPTPLRQRLPHNVLALSLLISSSIAVSVATQTAAAADASGWLLDANSWEQGKDLLPDPVLRRVQSGDYWFRVRSVDPEQFKRNYSESFWKAGADNAGKYGLDEATCGLVDRATGAMPEYFFGFPFPEIAPDDPQAACKMAWNFQAATYMGGGGGARFTLNGINTDGEFKRLKLEIHGQSFLGRHGGPIENRENLRATGIVNLLEPLDIDGVAGLSKTPNDWTTQDKVWFYVPATRRIRRVNAATRSDPIAGLDIFADDLNCYGGKVEYYRWKLLDEAEILAPMLSPEPFVIQKTGDTRGEVEIPYFSAAYETPGAKGIPWLVVENLILVPRPVWVIEGKAVDPYYNFGKVVMYMDKDMYRIYWKLVYNRAGEYFYNAMCAYHWARSEDGSFTAVAQNLTVGVNDKTNRAALGGRYSSQYFESAFDRSFFSLRTLSQLND